MLVGFVKRGKVYTDRGGRHSSEVEVLDGSSRGLSTASLPADRAQANQGVGKVPKLIPASLRDTSARNLGKALSRMAGRQNRVRDQASHSRKQQTVRPHSHRHSVH